MKIYAVRAAAFASMSLVATSIVSAQNLILNESFESPAFASAAFIYNSPSTAITHWTVSGSRNVVIHHSPVAGIATGNPTFNDAHQGNYYLDLSGSGAPHAVISQSFSTLVGQLYELSFWIGASNQTAPAATIHMQLDGAVTLLNTALTPSAPLVNINWTLQSFNFVADSATTVLSFQGLSGHDDNASFVDDCSVVLVPEPASALSLLASTVLFLRRRTL